MFDIARRRFGGAVDDEMRQAVHQRGRCQDQAVERKGCDQTLSLRLSHAALFFGVERFEPAADRRRHLREHPRQLHSSEVRRIHDGEANEGDAGQLKTTTLIVARLDDGGVQRVEQELRAFARNGGDQRVLVREMVVRRGGRDTGAACDIAER